MENMLETSKASNVDILLTFIEETKNGKFTSEVPNVASVVYQRLEIQEQEQVRDNNSNELILFGVS
jgi:hypothetical protein